MFNRFFVNIPNAEHCTRTEKGIHRTIGIRGDKNQAFTGDAGKCFIQKQARVDARFVQVLEIELPAHIVCYPTVKMGTGA